MTSTPNPARDRAEAAFRTVTPEEKLDDAMAEYRAREQAEREKMARLRAERLAREGKAPSLIPVSRSKPQTLTTRSEH